MTYTAAQFLAGTGDGRLHMRKSFVVMMACGVAALLAATQVQTAGPRTPWGEPDIQGVWTSEPELGVPFERAARFGEREELTDAEFAERFNLPKDIEGVVISRVEPMGPAFDADIERGHVLLEINRHPVRSIDDYRRLTANARSGEVLALYMYKPEMTRRELRTVKVD